MRMKNVEGVIKVFDAFEENNTAYYVMEFLDGMTMQKVIRISGGKMLYSLAATFYYSASGKRIPETTITVKANGISKKIKVTVKK